MGSAPILAPRSFKSADRKACCVFRVAGAKLGICVRVSGSGAGTRNPKAAQY